jgi:hypothetical protein
MSRTIRVASADSADIGHIPSQAGAALSVAGGNRGSFIIRASL